MNNQRPSTEDWDFLLDDIEKNRLRMMGTLVFSNGGGPGSVQRAKLRAVLEKAEIPPAAILIDSVLAWGVVSALRLFLNDRVRAFSHTEVEEALLFLKVSPPSWPEVKQALEKLRLEVRNQVPRPRGRRGTGGKPS